MSSDPNRPQSLVWATRGRAWGFRFLLDGGLPDPLVTYERAFDGLADSPTIYDEQGNATALRFPDPLGRRDSAGRTIPHEFVILGRLVETVHSAQEGADQIWPLVESAYSRIWDSEVAPNAADLQF